MCWKQISSHFTIKLHKSRSPIRLFCALVFIVSLDDVSLSKRKREEGEEEEEEEILIIKVNKKFRKSSFLLSNEKTFSDEKSNLKRHEWTFDRFIKETTTLKKKDKKGRRKER